MKKAIILAALAAPLMATSALAGANNQKICTATAALANRACGYNALDDYYLKSAACINLTDPAESSECQSNAKEELAENRADCGEQSAARLDICGKVGEAAYDPDFNPANFETEFHNLMHPNAYYPLGVGDRWEYRSNEGETDVVEVLDQTKEIDSIACVVVHDLVSVDGAAIEDTNDWFAQAKDGAVWYCGEEVKDYETFDGDDPVLPELVAIDGSFKTGRDEAKPGIIFPAIPMRGVTYREEFAIAEAEDVSTIVTTTYGYGADPSLDELVPPALAHLLCNDDCVVTNAFSANDPGVVERKYFAPGVGTFLETNPETGEVVQLVNCNFDPRCVSLPQP